MLVAFDLYCRLPFGKIHHGNPEIIQCASAIGRTPSALAMKLVNIAGIDPVITSSGRKGLSNASAADRSMWTEIHADWDRFVEDSRQALNAVGLVTEPETSPVDAGTGIPRSGGQDILVQSTARQGQDFFRSAVLSAYGYRCCITGLSIPTLLYASHIVPWSHDEANRVNPKNGLLLSVLHDRAFDRGLITLNDDLTVRVSQSYRGDTFFSTAVAAYDRKPIRSPEKFTPDREFLAYHREQVFQE